MRSFVNMIFFILRLVFRLIWNLFWGLVETVVVLGLLIFGLLYYANHSQSAIANAILDVKDRVVTYVSTQDDDLVGCLNNLTIDQDSHHTGERWENASATVYIDTDNTTLVYAYEEAIRAWNDTGAFTFNIVPDKSLAGIVLTEYSDAQSKAAGVAEAETDALTNEIKYVKVKLNTYYLTENNYGYSYYRIVYTAEHELGHAIGLDHDDSQQSVMQSSGSYYGIQPVDIENVKKLYAS